MSELGIDLKFFDIQRHKWPFLTQCHQELSSATLYWLSTTKYQPLLFYFDLVHSFTISLRTVEPTGSSLYGIYNSHVEYERWLRVRESIMWQDWTTNQPNSPPTNVPFLEELLWLWIHLYITALKSYSVLCILNTLYCWRTTFHHPPILVHQKANLLKITESPKLNWIQIPNLLEERLYRCWFHLTRNHESR